MSYITSSTSSIYDYTNKIIEISNNCNKNNTNTNEINKKLIKPKAIFYDDEREVPYQIIEEENDKFNHSLAVAQVILKNGKTNGTAWRLGPGNLMMTNSHVLSEENIDGAKIRFTRGEYVCIGSHYPCSDKYNDEFFVKVGNIISSSPFGDVSSLPDKDHLDYSLFTLDDKVFKSGNLDRYGYLKIDHEGGEEGEEIYIPQHGYSDINGFEKTIAYQEIYPVTNDLNKIDDVITNGTVNEVNNVMLMYNLDTSGGASGSPVISNQENKVIGIHARSSSTKNISINMKYIWPKIKDHYYDSLKEKNISINVCA